MAELVDMSRAPFIHTGNDGMSQSTLTIYNSFLTNPALLPAARRVGERGDILRTKQWALALHLLWYQHTNQLTG